LSLWAYVFAMVMMSAFCVASSSLSWPMDICMSM
jgi:hypothetical protein